LRFGSGGPEEEAKYLTKRTHLLFDAPALAGSSPDDAAVPWGGCTFSERNSSVSFGAPRPFYMRPTKEANDMAALILVLLLAALLFGVGFAFKFLWILAAVVLVLWLIGFVARGTEATWYRW
jgi:hypothetical protein